MLRCPVLLVLPHRGGLALASRQLAAVVRRIRQKQTAASV